MSSCYERADFERFASGLLDATEQAEFRSHLQSCEKCQTAYEEYQGTPASVAPAQSYTQTMTATPVPLAVGDSSPAGKIAKHLPKIEGYRIVGVLGQGGMGIVYHAVQTKLNRAVALKVLPAIVGTASPSAVSRFRREATAAARLHHTNIVPIYDFGESRDSYYYAMELITGQPLNVLVRRFAEQNIGSVGAAQLPHAVHSAMLDTPDMVLPTGEASRSADESSGSLGSSTMGRGRPYYQQVARWMADSADALHYAHGEGIIHRDIKPSNLILSVDGRIMIADFGLAKLVGEDSVTMTGSLLGTLRYISPEQAMAKRVRVDHRTDIYSLGASMYELLCFQPAFPGSDDKEILGAIIARDPIKPRKIESRIPHELETICLKTLEKSPEARYSTARALAEDLRRYIHDLPIVAKRPGVVRRSFKFVRRHRAPVIAITAAILLTAAGITLVHLRAESEAAQIRERETRVNSLVDRGRSIGLSARQSNELLEWNEAEAKLREALQEDPDHLKSMLVYVWLRIERFKRNPELKTNENLEELDEWCQRVLEREPESITALNYHGIVLKDLGRLEDAIRVATKMVQLDESDFAGWSNLGAYYALAGNLGRAEECLQEGAKLARDAEEFRAIDRAQAWRGLAAVDLHLQHENALAHIEQAISLKRDDIPSLILKARILLQRGGPDDHVEALEVAGYADYLSAGSNPRAKRIKALAHVRNGQIAQAIDHGAAAIQLGDMKAVNHLIIAVAEAMRPNAIGARDRLDDAAETWPEELKENPFVATYDEGILWFEAAAELEGLREEAKRLIAALEAQP